MKKMKDWKMTKKRTKMLKVKTHPSEND